MRQRWPHGSFGILLLLLAAGILLGGASGLSPSTAEEGSSLTPPDTTAFGVVWTPPTPPDSALRELARIDRLGATALRLTHLPADTVAARADTLGLRLYVDLPVDHVPASQLRDSLDRVVPVLERLQALARKHSSITHVGLARGTDTTMPGTCEVLNRWTERVHAQSPSLRTYYVTPFPAVADRCADAVDRPLLDLRGLSAPVTRWQRWRARTDSVGIGALGTWMGPDAAPGLRVPHSAEWQARYLERALGRLLDSVQTAPPAVFVSRWQDASSPLPASRRYGLHDGDGVPRPAARVVRGIYTGAQRVFAFPDGPESPVGSPGLLLLGWGLVALLGGLYAQSLFVRQTVARYFAAPGFYRDALRDGHDLHPGANGVLLGIVAGALGTTGVRVARMAARLPGIEHMIAPLPDPVQTIVAGGVEQPVWAGIAVGGLGLGLLGLWAVALVLVARWQAWFSLAQGLVLVVWPCWPTVLALPLALAAGPDAPVSPSLLALLLLGGGTVTGLYVTGRVLYDYWIVTDLPGSTVLLLGALSPAALIGALVLLLTTWYDVSLPFLWHLATLTA